MAFGSHAVQLEQSRWRKNTPRLTEKKYRELAESLVVGSEYLLVPPPLERKILWSSKLSGTLVEKFVSHGVDRWAFRTKAGWRTELSKWHFSLDGWKVVRV